MSQQINIKSATQSSRELVNHDNQRETQGFRLLIIVYLLKWHGYIQYLINRYYNFQPQLVYVNIINQHIDINAWRKLGH